MTHLIHPAWIVYHAQIFLSRGYASLLYTASRVLKICDQFAITDVTVSSSRPSKPKWSLVCCTCGRSTWEKGCQPPSQVRIHGWWVVFGLGRSWVVPASSKVIDLSGTQRMNWMPALSRGWAVWFVVVDFIGFSRWLKYWCYNHHFSQSCILFIVLKYKWSFFFISSLVPHSPCEATVFEVTHACWYRTINKIIFKMKHKCPPCIV